MSHTSPAEGLESKSMSSMSPAGGLEPTANLMLVHIKDLHLQGSKAGGGSQKTCANGVKDLQTEGPALEPESDTHGEDESSPGENNSHSL
ncbi:hypothetical protein H920_05905 [Fukomys damarensis]|uniref:Uncharacterized protein n=1 Tax=Fukomys damarensis TaxID=885580 RepID=A0A091EBS5_FUKDA|nr:hypothetical protein H920_05905 [Fukomys damarensis]